MCFWCMHFAMSPFSQSKCPLCREQYVHLPGVCGMLHKYLQKAFPEEYARRAQDTAEDEVRYGVSSLADTDGSEADTPGDPAEGWRPEDFSAPVLARPAPLPQLDRLLQELFPEQREQQMAALQASTWPPSQAAIEGLQPPAATVAPQPSGSAAVGRGSGLTLPNLSSAFSDRFVHYRIGCDSCGVFPIVGKRYHCKDCSEQIGFDLCGACYDGNRNACGRFNQHHHPEHEMELVHNAPSLLHILQATNPELDPEQLRGLVAMGTDGAAQTQAVQRLLELPLATATTGAPRTLSLVGPQPGQPEQSRAEGRADGEPGSSSSGRRRRASSEPQADVAADGSEVVTPARRRRRNNREAFVCIFAPASTDAAGQGPQVAVAVYARPQGGDAAGSEGAAAPSSAAPAGDQNGAPASLSLHNPLSAEGLAAMIMARTQGRGSRAQQTASTSAAAGSAPAADAAAMPQGDLSSSTDSGFPVHSSSSPAVLTVNQQLNMQSNGNQARQDVMAGGELYIIIKDLGRGAFGFVRLAINRRTNEKVAIKYIARGRGINKHVERELRSHISFCHPHIVRFRHLFLTETHLAIVFEYCAGGDLYQYVSKKGCLSEDEARRFFQQLVIGLEYCHKMGVVNRDIKLENALLDGDARLLKLTDFGYAKTDVDSLPISQVGTPNYAAPEVISSAQRQYDGCKADTWSCGVLLYVMLFHKYPFERPEDPVGQQGLARVVQRTIAVDYQLPDRPRITPQCKDMLQHLLVKDPKERYGTDDIMRHPWFLHGLPRGWERLNADCLNMRMNKAEQDRKEQWIKQIWEEAKEVARPAAAAPTPAYNHAANIMDSGNMDPGFQEAYEAEMANPQRSNY
ncbi:hypothetical protein WJX73_002872 [Symbiochloris irregularis]|uniref:Uncharacterized protein n=1 Tax=Symbiochloris irregularis TaxID=706552 RepID=A0AAW1PDM3_9CHLO